MTGIAIELVLDINFSFVIIDLLIFAAKFENQTAQLVTFGGFILGFLKWSYP